MIISHLQAGLGNQMFQYAAGLALAEHRRTFLKLDPSWFRHDPLMESHNKYSLSCFNITEQFATEDEVRRVRGSRLSRADRYLKRAANLLNISPLMDYYNERGVSKVSFDQPFTPDFFQLPDNTYLKGLWQSEKYFKPASNTLRLHFSFRYPPSPAAAEISERIRASRTPVFVHFRRGDYVRTARVFEELKKLPPAEAQAKKAEWLEKIGCAMPLSLDYYQNALRLLEEKHGDLTLFIFSDDIAAVEREFKPSGKHFFIKENISPPDTLRVMSLCEHAVIANSSFSWWAAWLNPSATKTVVAPASWFPSGGPLNDEMVPAEWVRVPSDPAG